MKLDFKNLTTLTEGWKGKFIEIGIIIFVSWVLLHYKANILESVERSAFFFDLITIVIALSAFLIGLSILFYFFKGKIKGEEKLPRSLMPIIWESKTLFSDNVNIKKISIIIAIVMFFMTLFYQFQIERSIIPSTEYSVFDNQALNTMLSVFSAFVEDYYYFALMPIVILIITFISLMFIAPDLDFTTKMIISFVIILIINPLFFTFDHSRRYGLTKVKETIDVWIFGQVCTGWVLTMRDLSLPHSLHSSGNIAYNAGFSVIG